MIRAKKSLGQNFLIDNHVIEKIINACKKTGADAVHPGYGFLSENSAFVNQLESAHRIILIKEIKSHLQNDQRNKMLITNYSFFSVILDKKLYSPGRWYLSDGTDYPLKNNKFFKKYN